jgi:hypothetical protein
MTPAKACSHLARKPDLEVLFVVDAHLTLADAFMECRVCGAHYLIELIDIAQGINAYRVAWLPAAAVAATLRSLSKGSCDVNRASAELAHAGNTAQPLGGVLLRDETPGADTLWSYIRQVGNLPIPTASWRHLPCDGKTIAALQRISEKPARTDPTVRPL